MLSCVLLMVLLLCVLPVTVLANAPGPNMDGTYNANPIIVVVIIVVYAILVVATCLTEWLVSIPFHLHSVYGKRIVLTNVVTQVIMHILEVSFFAKLALANSFGSYALFVAVLEVLVYISEFLIYCKIIPNYSKKRLLLYTICANTASLLIGLLLLVIIL